MWDLYDDDAVRFAVNSALERIAYERQDSAIRGECRPDLDDLRDRVLRIAPVLVRRDAIMRLVDHIISGNDDPDVSSRAVARRFGVEPGTVTALRQERLYPRLSTENLDRSPK